MRSALISLTAAMMLAACQTAAPEAPPTPAPSSAPAPATQFNWVCPDGARFTVSYPDRGSALVTFNGQSKRLPAMVGASGIRFAADGVEFWEHQGEARFTDAGGGVHLHCRVN